MKFGVTLAGLRFRDYAAVVAAYEDCGFESVWIPEHLVFPADMPPRYPYTATGQPPVTADTPTYDPWVVLGYVAAMTTRIRLATNVYILPLRHPLQTARSVVTVDRVSGGRVTLGVGVGWLPDEFDYVGVDFASRGRQADAAIDAIRRLWSEDVVTVDDGHFRFGPVKFQPKPLQKPSVPIEVGGAAPAALRRAGRLGDGWIEIGSADVDQFSARLAVVRGARHDAGRTGPFEVTASGTLASAGGTPAGRVGGAAGGSAGGAVTLDGVRRLADAGATRVVVGPGSVDGGPLTAADAVAWAGRFADEILGRL
ncbi:MAG TPA: LLM class F420-dependent oxidoreductase [Acidimicrobiales bacterium]|nr:LLM class F420-dependent oxidoreductase [Acidimicrobiales bacterium]